MAGLPPGGTYRINRFESQLATILQGNELHGHNGIGTDVTLEYIIQEQGLCTLRIDQIFLGVHILRNGEPVVLMDKQRWILQRAVNGGITIKYPDEPEGVQYFWRLYGIGQPVVIHDYSDGSEIQTWDFAAV